MNLKSASVIPAGPVISIYSGICLYLSNSASQSASLSGGRAPMMGFHSVIDRPDSVRRVMPPTITMTNTRNATENSQLAIATGRFPEAPSMDTMDLALLFMGGNVCQNYRVTSEIAEKHIQPLMICCILTLNRLCNISSNQHNGKIVRVAKLETLEQRRAFAQGWVMGPYCGDHIRTVPDPLYIDHSSGRPALICSGRVAGSDHS